MLRRLILEIDFWFRGKLHHISDEKYTKGMKLYLCTIFQKKLCHGETIALRILQVSIIVYNNTSADFWNILLISRNTASYIGWKVHERYKIVPLHDFTEKTMRWKNNLFVHSIVFLIVYKATSADFWIRLLTSRKTASHSGWKVRER